MSRARQLSVEATTDKCAGDLETSLVSPARQLSVEATTDKCAGDLERSLVSRARQLSVEATTDNRAGDLGWGIGVYMKCNAVIETRRTSWATGELDEPDQGVEAPTNVSGGRGAIQEAHTVKQQAGRLLDMGEATAS